MTSITRSHLAVPCTLLLFMLACLFPPAAISATDDTEERAPGRTMADQATKGKQLWITTDHQQWQTIAGR